MSVEYRCLDQRRLFLFSIHLESVPGVIDYNDLAVRIDFHGAGAHEFLFVARVVGESQRALANHVWIRSQLVSAPLGEHSFPVELRDVTTVWSEDRTRLFIQSAT